MVSIASFSEIKAGSGVNWQSGLREDIDAAVDIVNLPEGRHPEWLRGIATGIIITNDGRRWFTQDREPFVGKACWFTHDTEPTGRLWEISRVYWSRVDNTHLTRDVGEMRAILRNIGAGVPPGAASATFTVNYKDGTQDVWYCPAACANPFHPFARYTKLTP